MPMRPNFLTFIAAFATGGLISLMLLFNGTLAAYGSLLFSSWVPHLTGGVLAIAILLIRKRPTPALATKAPWWAYLGGISGALTVVLTSASLNSALALSGTLALGLGGQMAFSLLADARGMMGLPQRTPTQSDYIALALIMAGAFVLIFGGGA